MWNNRNPHPWMFLNQITIFEVKIGEVRTTVLENEYNKTKARSKILDTKNNWAASPNKRNEYEVAEWNNNPIDEPVSRSPGDKRQEGCTSNPPYPAGNIT